VNRKNIGDEMNENQHLSPIQELAAYVREHAVRGTCRCGKCNDHPGVDAQPQGHMADTVFFLVSNNGGTSEELRALVEKSIHGEFGNDVNVFDNKEHGYMELGAWIGDQGVALSLMGLGDMLGLWHLLTPKSVLGLEGDQAMEIAGYGMVTIKSGSGVEATSLPG